MPSYLVHGFRWPRVSIRNHIVYDDIDDAATNYICSPKTSAALTERLQHLYPDIMGALPELRFVEQYDPEDESTSSAIQPFAFVADKVETTKLSLDATKAMDPGLSAGAWNALTDLKDRLAPGEPVRWWVVHNGDETRSCKPIKRPVSYQSPEKF